MKLSGLTDQYIWTSFKEGENWAVSYIYAEYAEKLYHYGLKFTNEIVIIEDSLQDLFTELINNRIRLGVTDNILFYLLKSYKRKLLRRLQSEKRFLHADEMESYQFDVSWSVEHDLILQEISQEKAEKLLSVLKNLTPRQKEAIYLRFTRELDYNQVAGIMEISIESCRNLISKAISELKKKLAHEKNFKNVILLLMPEQ